MKSIEQLSRRELGLELLRRSIARNADGLARARRTVEVLQVKQMKRLRELSRQERLLAGVKNAEAWS